jgi:hypothetical protein
MAEDERPDDSVRNCDCSCHDNGIGKTGSTVRVLGSTHNPIDLYVSTPARTKWIFVDDVEKEVDNTTIKLKEKVA